MRPLVPLLAVAALVASAGPAGALTLTALPATVSDASGQVTIDIFADVDVIQYDLQIDWDVAYWTLNSVVGADGVVEQDDTNGRIDDVFWDAGLGDPIAAGAVLFSLVMDVVGSPAPPRAVLEVGNLSVVDASFFDRAVLLADPDFDVLVPASDRSENAVVMTPEPAASVLAVAAALLLPALRWTRS
jgi:hypothetical protein